MINNKVVEEGSVAGMTNKVEEEGSEEEMTNKVEEDMEEGMISKVEEDTAVEMTNNPPEGEDLAGMTNNPQEEEDSVEETRAVVEEEEEGLVVRVGEARASKVGVVGVEWISTSMRVLMQLLVRRVRRAVWIQRSIRLRIKRRASICERNSFSSLRKVVQPLRLVPFA